MLRLRQAVEADIDSLITLLEQLFTIEQDFTADPDKQRRGLDQLLRSQLAYVVVAVLDGDILGMASLQVVISTAEGGRAGWVEDVVVREDQRGHGIGRAMLAHLSEWAKDNNLTRLQLLADQDNQAALDFYQHLGWSGTSLLAFKKSLT